MSSTYVDLHDERQEIMQALLELDCIPAGMELFPAANDDQWTLIKRVIDDCDYYLVVLGGRYGSIGPTGLSYTQMEYEYAVQQGKPVMAFLHKTPGSIPADKSEATADGKAKLAAFRDLVQKRICKYWTTPADLGSSVSRSLVKLIKDNPAVGWVRADNVPSEGATEEILRLTKEVDSLKRQLSDSNADRSIEELSQGDEPVRLAYAYEIVNPHNYKSFAYGDEVEVTWDRIFGVLSPLMINEASEATLKKNVDNLLGEILFDALSADHKGFNVREITVELDSFSTVKVQLLALKLIKKSDAKTRGVNDRSTYWTLTERGVTKMMQLRAIRRVQGD